MRTESDGTTYTNRRDFLKAGVGIIALAGGIGLSGCLGSGDGDKPSKLTEPGSYMIRKANEIYPVSDIPDAEAEIKKFEKWADDMSTGKPLYAISAMLYSVKHKISPEGSVTPTPTVTPAESVEYPFDTNAVTMDMIMQYLDGKIDESKFSALFDSESVRDLAMMKKKGLTVDKYAVTEGRETGSDDVKYLINTYQTKPDASNQVLTGYMHLKLEKKGTKWVPSKVVESEVYTPKGELGYVYAGRFGRTDIEKPQIKHIWIEKKENAFPFILEAMDNTGKGMTVDKFLRNVLRYSEIPKGVVKQIDGGSKVIFTKRNYDGGEVIVLRDKISTTHKFPSGEYELEFYVDPDSNEFDQVLANYYNEYRVITALIAVGEAYGPNSNGMAEPKGLALFMKKMGSNGGEQFVVQDGFLRDKTVVPADGIIDYVISR